MLIIGWRGASPLGGSDLQWAGGTAFGFEFPGGRSFAVFEGAVGFSFRLWAVNLRGRSGSTRVWDSSRRKSCFRACPSAACTTFQPLPPYVWQNSSTLADNPARTP